MLTTAFYYNVYRPYIFQRPGMSALLRKSPYAGNPSNVRIERNNAVRQPVVDYIESVCRNTLDVKDTSKYLVHNSENYFVNVVTKSFETVKTWVEEDVSMFVDAFNAAVGFGVSQTHSSELETYANNLRDIAEINAEHLKTAGVTVNQDGMSLNFSPGKLRSMEYSAFANALSGAARAAVAVYDRTTDFLHLPATAHMNFRQLNYYYNYRIERAPGGVNLKETTALYTGLLLDRVI